MGELKLWTVSHGEVFSVPCTKPTCNARVITTKSHRFFGAAGRTYFLNGEYALSFEEAKQFHITSAVKGLNNSLENARLFLAAKAKAEQITNPDLKAS